MGDASRASAPHSEMSDPVEPPAVTGMDLSLTPSADRSGGEKVGRLLSAPPEEKHTLVAHHSPSVEVPHTQLGRITPTTHSPDSKNACPTPCSQTNRETLAHTPELFRNFCWKSVSRDGVARPLLALCTATLPHRTYSAARPRSPPTARVCQEKMGRVQRAPQRRSPLMGQPRSQRANAAPAPCQQRQPSPAAELVRACGSARHWTLCAATRGALTGATEAALSTSPVWVGIRVNSQSPASF